MMYLFQKFKDVCILIELYYDRSSHQKNGYDWQKELFQYIQNKKICPLTEPCLIVGAVRENKCMHQVQQQKRLKYIYHYILSYSKCAQRITRKLNAQQSLEAST